MASYIDGHNEISVFRVSRVTVYFFAICAAVSAVGFAIFLFSLIRVHAARETMVIATPWFVVSVWLVIATLMFKAYRIEAGDTGLKVAGLLRSRIIDFQDIKKITLKDGFRGGDLVELYGSTGRRLLRVTSGIDGVEALLGIIRMRASKYGAIFLRRDKYGTWQHPPI